MMSRRAFRGGLLRANNVFSRHLTTKPLPLVSWTLNTNTKVGTITLDSPATYNALTVEMGQTFQTLVRQLESNIRAGALNVNAVVITGAGSDAFSAGGNFDWLRSLKDRHVYENADTMLSFYKSFLCIRQLPVPVVAAIQGPAIGAGACLALACDLRVTSPGPRRLGFTFSTLGIHSGMGGSHLLTRAIGGPSAIVNEILLTGKSLSGEEAFKYGLVNRLSDNVKEEAHSLAEEVSRQNPLAIRSMIQTLRQRQDEGLEACLQREAYAQALCYDRDDWGEGLDSLINKRDPVFDDYHSQK